VTLRLGLPVTDELTFQPHYSIYESQLKIPNSSKQPYNDCSAPLPGITPVPPSAFDNCLTNGEASLAIKQAAAQGEQLTSLVGFSLVYNTLDDNKNPTTGVIASYKQDFAGLGGDSKFIRETFDARYYYPLTDDFVGFLRGQGGQINAFGGQPLNIINNFNVGPSLVRGFAPGGIGPRDISDLNNLQAAGLGGTTYFGGTAEVDFPIFGLPREIGLRGGVFADAGTLFGYNSQTNFNSLLGNAVGTACYPSNSASPTAARNFTQGNCLQVDDEKKIRASIGASLIWASPLGPIRVDYAFPVLKGKYDQTQAISFSGGSSF
jgi:outer membrane protein insertion porin family